MAINWSNLGEKIPGIAAAVEEGLLRQRELGGVAYTAAAQKEAARVAGATKKMESQQEALMERAKIESRYLEDINKEMATNPPVWDPDAKQYVEGAELFQQSLRAQERAADAWRQVYESRGMKYPKPGEMDWSTIAENIAKTFVGGTSGPTFQDLRDAFNKDRNDKGARKSIMTVIDRSLLTLTPKQKSDLEDAVIDKITTMDVSEIEGFDSTTPPAITYDITEAMELPSSREVMAKIQLNVPQSEIPDLMTRATVVQREAEARAAGIEKYMHSYLRTKGLNIDIDDVRSYITTGMDLRNRDTGEVAPLSPEIKEHLTVYTDAWKENNVLRGQIKAQIRRIQARIRSRGMATNRTGIVSQVEGIKDLESGMITQVDQADEERVSYAPEAVNLRYKGEGTNPLAGKRIRTLNEIMGD